MTEPNHPHGETPGILYAGGAYFIWGLVPLYWALLRDVSPIEITMHRILWCALLGIVLTAARGRFSRVISVIRTPRLLGALAASGLLITANWTLYMYCVTTRQLVDTALGYYLTPLVSIALGIVGLNESISRIRLAAIALASIAVGVEAFALGHIPWIAPALALTFGFYGYVRKLTPVDALDGLTIETALFFPVTLVFVTLWALNGTGAFPAGSLTRDSLIVFTGPLTALPLVMFAAGARRLRMTTLGFLQYLSPSIVLVVAILVLHEPFDRTNAIAFGLIWAALVLVSLEGRVPLLTRRVAE